MIGQYIPNPCPGPFYMSLRLLYVRLRLCLSVVCSARLFGLDRYFLIHYGFKIGPLRQFRKKINKKT